MKIFRSQLVLKRNKQGIGSYLFNYLHRSKSIIMGESSAASKFFEHLPEYSLAICRECRYGVLPSHIPNHLQCHYRVTYKQAESIGEEVSSWANLFQYASQLEVPNKAINPISQLPVHTDGLICQLEPERC